MSRYTYRHVEVKVQKIDGYAHRMTDDIIKYAKDGQTWCFTGEEKRYRKFINGEWVVIDKPDSEWKLCKLYHEVDRPALEKNEYPEHYWNPWRSIKTMKDGDNERYFKCDDSFENNGGAIRDEYLSNWVTANVPNWSGRGLPSDCSKELLDSLIDEETGEIYNYSYTHITLAELNTIYDSEEKRITGMLKDQYVKQMNSSIEKKLDYIIAHMKDPLSVNPSDLNKKTDDEDDEDAYYDSPEYIIDEYFINLYLLAAEIAKIELISEHIYDVYSAENVRIVYYVS